MSDSYDVEIEIFGRVSDIGKMSELAEEAAGEGYVAWGPSFEADELPSLIDEAVREKRALVLTRSDTGDLFECTREACRAAGLSYLVSYGDNGGEGFDNVYAWRPGMEDEIEFALIDGAPALSIEEVHTLAAQGVDAVNARVGFLNEHFKVGRIEVEPGFAEAFRDFRAAGPRP